MSAGTSTGFFEALHQLRVKRTAAWLKEGLAKYNYAVIRRENGYLGDFLRIYRIVRTSDGETFCRGYIDSQQRWTKLMEVPRDIRFFVEDQVFTTTEHGTLHYETIQAGAPGVHAFEDWEDEANRIVVEIETRAARLAVLNGEIA